MSPLEQERKLKRFEARERFDVLEEGGLHMESMRNKHSLSKTTVLRRGSRPPDENNSLG